MHEMQTIVTDVCGVCLSVCQSVSLSVCHAGSFGAAFAKLFWSLVAMTLRKNVSYRNNFGRRVPQ